MTWRKLRRLIGYWIAGDGPRSVHCGNCGYITSAYCVECRTARIAALQK